jgi:hypothetical protein
VVLKQRRVEIITDKAGTLKYSFYHDADKVTTTLTQSSVPSETTEAEATITWTNDDADADSSDLTYLSVQYTVEDDGIRVTTEGGGNDFHKWYQAKKDNKGFRYIGKKSGSQKKQRELLMKNLSETFGEEAAKKYDLDDSDVYQLISQQENERGITIFTVFKKAGATTSNIRYFRDYTRSLTEEEKEAGDHAECLTFVQAQVNRKQTEFILEEGRIFIDGDTMTIKAENPDLEAGGKMQRSAKEAVVLIGEKQVWKEDIDTTTKAQEHKKNFTKDKYCYLEKKTARDVKKNGFGDAKDYKVCVINDGKVATELFKGANLRLGSMTGYVTKTRDGEDVIVLDGEEVQLRGREEGEYTLNKSEYKVTIEADKMYLYGKTLGNSKEGWLLQGKRESSRSVILDSVILKGLTRSKDFTFGGLFEGFTLCGLLESSGHYTGKSILVLYCNNKRV